MEGVSEEQMRGWRTLATDFLLKNFIYTLDPCRRKRFHDEPYSANLAKRIVKMDLQDISRSSVILANLKDIGPGRAWGSVAEIAHAHTKNKIIITIVEKDYHHPFIDFYSTEIHHDLESALQVIPHYYG